jgi:transposase
MKPLSQQCQKDVISLLQHNKSTREIANQLHVSHSTVSRIRKKILPDTQKSSGGHPQALTKQDERTILRSISSGHCDTATEAWKNLTEHQNINISA